MLRTTVLVALLLCTGPVLRAQDSTDEPPAPEALIIGLRELLEGEVEVAGQGSEAIGLDLDLMGTGRPRHRVGDDPAWSLRSCIDTGWTGLTQGKDTMIAGATVHWVRYHPDLSRTLAGMPLELGIETHAAFTLYVNGRMLATAEGGPAPRGALPATDSLPRTVVPVAFMADGAPEVIALRLVVPAGTALRTSGLHLTLHAPAAGYLRNRRMMHYGVFIGINAIILLLAAVLGWSDRSDRSWPLLAMMSLLSVLGTWCDVAGEQAALGLNADEADLLNKVNHVLFAWPLYLLVRLLGHLHGRHDRRRELLTTASVLLTTGIILLFTVASTTFVMGRDLDIKLDGPVALVLIVMAVLGLVLTLAIGWLLITVVRMGLKLLRSPGYARWLGIGALVSGLFSLALDMAGHFSGYGLGSWLSLIADYCTYVAVPVSAAVYLAIRSAHHNRLVARQRDELDAEVKERTAELRTERDRSNELLLNILPAEVADELKAKGSADARHFDRATVLFTDFRGFTQLSEQVGPAELVQELNACFKAFDAIMEKYRIEKIKTIGDSYMAAGGLPDPAHGGPVAVVRAALEMQDFMVKHKAERAAAGKPFFEMRVGIHSGPVVAGIVGMKKFQYDIWGDTVNTASRMESSGEVGQVNISEATYELVKDEPGLSFTSRGKVQAKGKGEMEMFFVHRSAEGA